METEDPLSQLKDIHLPDAVTTWPPAPGWWILLALAILGLVYLYRRSIAAMIRRRKLNTVLVELDLALERYREQAPFDDRRNQAGLDYLADVNTLLKRVSLVVFPDAGLAELTGKPWLKFLDACDNGDSFTAGAGAPLGDGLYRRTFDADVDALHALAKGWIQARYRDKDPVRKAHSTETEDTERAAA